MGYLQAGASGSGSAWTTPQALAEQIAEGAAIDVLYVHLPFGAELEAAAGADAHERFIAVAEITLAACLDEVGSPFGVQRWPADDLVAWVADTPTAPRRPTRRLENLDLAITAFLRDALRRKDLPDLVHSRLDEVSIARARVQVTAGPPLRAYARALRAAQREACDPVARELQEGAALMDRALAERAFIFHHQPIVDVKARSLLAYEALCRGTLDDLRFPDKIFSIAERTHKVWELGRVLRDIAAAGLAEEAPLGTSLFVNVHPTDIDDPCFLEQALSGQLAQHAPRIVLELTERAAIRDYRRVKAFFGTLRRHGYRLAIDDLGSGYAGLTALAELEPDFIKFDMGLIRDLHLHPVKQRLIGRMQEFAIEIGAETISEGVESAHERDALLRAGCTLMQGYFFARPAHGYCDVPMERFGDRAANREMVKLAATADRFPSDEEPAANPPRGPIARRTARSA